MSYDMANVAWGDIADEGHHATMKPQVLPVAAAPAEAPVKAVSAPTPALEAAAQKAPQGLVAAPSGTERVVTVSHPIYDPKAVLRKLGASNVGASATKASLHVFYEDLVGNFLLDRACNVVDVQLVPGPGPEGISGRALVRMFDFDSVTKALAASGSPNGDAELGDCPAVAVEISRQTSVGAPRSFLQAVGSAGASGAAAAAAAKATGAKAPAPAPAAAGQQKGGQSGAQASGQRPATAGKKAKEPQQSPKDREDGRWGAFSASQGGKGSGASGQGEAGEVTDAFERRKLGLSVPKQAEGDADASGEQANREKRSQPKPKAAAAVAGDKLAPKAPEGKANIYSALLNDDDEEEQ